MQPYMAKRTSTYSKHLSQTYKPFNTQIQKWWTIVVGCVEDIVVEGDGTHRGVCWIVVVVPMLGLHDDVTIRGQRCFF